MPVQKLGGDLNAKNVQVLNLSCIIGTSGEAYLISSRLLTNEFLLNYDMRIYFLVYSFAIYVV